MKSEIYQCVINKFNELNIFPQQNEWTVLAGIVLKSYSRMECISLATGLKCLGISQISDHGDIVHDLHAEVLCKRSFRNYLYHEMLLALESKDSIFDVSFGPNSFKLKDDHYFYMYISHPPCI